MPFWNLFNDLVRLFGVTVLMCGGTSGLPFVTWDIGFLVTLVTVSLIFLKCRPVI